MLSSAESGRSKVDQNRLLLIGPHSQQDQIIGLDVAMHDPSTMNFRQDAAKLANEPSHANGRKRSGFERHAQRRPVQKRHRQTGLARDADPGIADGDYPRMLNRAERGHFLGEVVANPALMARLRVEYLYCDSGIAVIE